MPCISVDVQVSTDIQIIVTDSGLGISPAIAEKIMNQPLITEIFPEPSYEELEKALAEWMNPENQDADVEEETTNTTTTKTAAKPDTEKVTDVASAFNDLFNQ